MSEQSQIRSAIEKGTEYTRSGDIKKAIPSFESAYNISLDLKIENIRRTCAFNLGAAYVADKQGKKGLHYLKKSIPSGDTMDGRSNGDLYFNLGLAHESIGNDKEAVQMFRKALEEYKSETDSSTFPYEVEVLEKLCKLYDKSNNTHAIDTYGELSERYKSLNQPVKQLKALLNKTKRLLKFNKTEETKKAVSDCEELITPDIRKDTSSSGQFHNELGLIYIELKMFKDARGCFEAALSTVREQKDSVKEEIEANVLQNLGISCGFVGDYEKAIQYNNEAAKKYAKLKQREKQGHCFANLGFVFTKRWQMDEAKENFNHALLAAEDTDDMRSQWQAREALGDIDYNENKLKDAAKHFKEALKAATINGASDHLDRLFEKLGSCSKPRKINWERIRGQRNKSDSENTAGSSEDFSPDNSDLD